MITTIDRVQAQAAQLQPLKILLSVLAAPFYVLGWVFGVVWVVLSWSLAAVLVGVTDARSKVTAHGSG